jgi:hypothetical protein
MRTPLRTPSHALALLPALLLVAASCGDPTAPLPDLPAVEDQQTTTDLETEPDVVIGSPCKTAADCDPSSDCVVAVQCVEGSCQYTYAQQGKSCSEGCWENGFCDGAGSCENLQPRECPESDGNICTVPSCDPATGECFENPIEDGKPPYLSSDCWEGAVCMGGQQDNTNATPSALALECEALTEELSPFGCIDQYICAGGDEPCKAIHKSDGAPCWLDEDEGCLGRSCNGGQCVVDHALDAECAAEDLPESCDGPCQACTDVSCHWIPDPANPRSPSKKVRYCRPEAKVGFACSADPCLLGQACAVGSQANGPLGKETLGACGGGLTKSKEQCLEELGKPALECLVAGTGCSADKGGCFINQGTADNWCWPPEWKCFDKNDTYCTHLDSGENWNEETGCHTAWVDLNCNDSNDCTVDVCKVAGEQWKCEHQAVDGASCDDGDPCTVGGKCEAGICGAMTPKCKDEDDNPCNDPTCDPFSGECKPAQTNGYPCNDNNACTIGDSCQDLVCLSGDAVDCDDGNACTNDFCDAVQGCLHEDKAGSCSDGDACTTNDACAGGTCIPGPALDCDDGNPCTNDWCNPAEGCAHGNASGQCSDGNACTDGDTCVNGICTPGPALDCDDDNACTTDSCLPASGCKHVNKSGSCSDGDACTTNDACVGGTCVPGPALDCDDGNPCTNDWCNPAEGCAHGNASGQCSDGNTCTDGDTCVNGLCTPGPALDCDDDNVCTTDSCLPASGCKHVNKSGSCTDGNACTDGDACVNGLCTPGPALDCDDDNVCTTDSCLPASGCKHVNAAGPCTDGSICTQGDACAAGQCVPGPQIDCDDKEYCTVDSCHPTNGCIHTPLADFTSCPGGLNANCQNGVCTCTPNCAGKNCGTDGCNGSCGTCDPGQSCVNGQCQGGGGPSGSYLLSPAVNFKCGEIFGTWLVTLNFSSLSFNDDGVNLFVSPAMNGCCSMQGDSAADGSFTVQCTCPGGGVCDENYKLTGTFADATHWSGTLTATYSGGLCFDCSFKTWSLSGTKQ